MDKPGNEMYKQIGQRIREVRTKRGMSQQDLATGADISLPHISEIELGKTQMRVSTLIRIAEALQISTDVLLRPNIPQVNSIVDDLQTAQTIFIVAVFRKAAVLQIGVQQIARRPDKDPSCV